MCLFHAMLGGEPHDLQFKNLHPGRARKTDSTGKLVNYDGSILNGKLDEYDTDVYQHATFLFNQRWEAYKDRLPKHPTCQSFRGAVSAAHELSGVGQPSAALGTTATTLSSKVAEYFGPPQLPESKRDRSFAPLLQRSASQVTLNPLPDF